MRHLLAILATVALLVAAAAGAQQFEDYRMFGEPPAAAAQQPSLEDYGRLSDTYRSASALDMTQRGLSAFRARLLATVEAAPRAASDAHAALAAASPTGDAAYFLGLLVFLIFLIGIGRAVATLFAVYVARPVFVGMQRPDPQGMAEKLPVLAARIGLVIVGLLLTLATALLVGAGFYPDDDAVSVRAAIIVFVAYAAMRFVDTLWRMILAPFLREYRVPAMGDAEARKLYRWLAAVSVLEILCAAALYWLDSLGVPQPTSAALHIASIVAMSALAAGGAWANRRTVSGALLGGREPLRASWPARAAATLWGPALLAYLCAGAAVYGWRVIMGETVGLRPLSVVFAVLMMAITIYAVTVFAVERIARRRRRRARMFVAQADDALADGSAGPAPRDPKADGGPMGGEDDEGGGVAQRQAPLHDTDALGAPAMRTFEDLARRVASLFALGAAVWTLIVIWGGREAFAPGTPLDVAQGVVDILFVGYVAYHAVRIWIDRRIEMEGGFDVETEPGDEGGASAASRLATLLPLVRNAVLALIVASVALFVAMELGVNVAPLLGGAGVIGLAIGFGSQALIRDILSGAFFLIDDAFRKGEYIDIGGVKGTVEQISVRSFQLRHHLGALHTVPFGEIKHLTNFSRDWVMMKLPLRLTYDTDPDKVRKLIKKLGERLLDHPEEGRKFMQPLKSQGVYMMEDSAMIIRVKYMTRPGDQWTTRKLVYQEIRQLFAQEGIKFAHREVTVRIPELEGDRERGLSAGEMQAIGAAARRAVDDSDAAVAKRPLAVGDDR